MLCCFCRIKRSLAGGQDGEAIPEDPPKDRLRGRAAATPLPAPVHPADGGRLGAPSVVFLVEHHRPHSKKSNFFQTAAKLSKKISLLCVHGREVMVGGLSTVSNKDSIQSPVSRCVV